MPTTTRLTSSCCTPTVMMLLTQNGINDNTCTCSAGASVTFRPKSRMTRKCHVRFGNGGGAGDRSADRNWAAQAGLAVIGLLQPFNPILQRYFTVQRIVDSTTFHRGAQFVKEILHAARDCNG